MQFRGSAFVGIVSLLVVSVAAAATTPPKGRISGAYTFTYRATNAPSIPAGTLDVRVLGACAAPCKAFTTTERAHGETKDRGKPRHWKLVGRMYLFGPVTHAGISDCVGRAKKRVNRGYDGTSTISLVPGSVRNGRISSFKGTGRDDYLPNAKGREAGCVAGAYVYLVTAVSA